jgi:DUF1707 SHOCT-like domain
MTESTNRQPGGIRASNRDRERVASILRTAGTDGLLTLSEMDERMALAYAATYRHELEPLTADLPGAGRPLYSRSPEFQAHRDEVYAQFRRGMLLHAAIAAGVVAIAVITWAIVGAGHHFFPFPIFVIALISLAVHAHRGRWAYGPPPWYTHPRNDPTYWA